MKDKPKNKDIVSIIIISILVIAMLIGIVTIIKQGTEKEKQQEKLAYTELIQKIENILNDIGYSYENKSKNRAKREL